MKSTFRSPNDGNFSYKKQDFIVHQHMLAHYRRLYSVKCGIDTSTPTHFKPRYKPKPRPSLPSPDTSSQHQLSNKDLKFLKCLAGEVRSWWNQAGSRHPLQLCEDKNCTDRGNETVKTSSQDKMHESSLEQHLTESCNKGITPLSVKTFPKKKKDLNLKKSVLVNGASSKLREMSVYHPPRRRLGTGVANKYCGQCASRMNKGSRLHSCEDIAETSHLFANEISTVIEEQKEELLYLQFVQDITQDILTNEIYSNEGLMIMFKKHLSLNREKLDRDKMMKEIEKLGAKIGLPQFNCPTLMDSNRFSFGEMREENGEYEYYEDYRPKAKNSSLLTFDHKSKYLGDFNVSLSSLSDNEIGQIKESEIFDQKKKESKVLGFLEEMGFDSNIAEEICVCMSDKDFSKFQFATNESEASPGFPSDFISAREIEDYNCKRKEHKSKSVTELLHYCDADYDFDGDNKAQDDILFDQQERMEMDKLLESMNGSEITQDDVGSIQAVSADVHSKSRESERESTFEGELCEESLQEKHSKKSISEQKSKVNSSSPMGSDYSSMKDHDESIYEGSSGEQDGHESASEEAEEIPEDLSQSSMSSGISQITEKLKGFNVDMNSVLRTRSKERNNLSSENNNQSLRELVL